MKGAFKRYAPIILSCIGSVGVIATVVTAVQATPKAVKLLEDAKSEKGEELTCGEIVQAAAPVYIPSVLLGIGTMSCIFGASAISQKHQAALVGAYALLDRAYKDYSGKAKELLGKATDVEIKKSIAKDKAEETDICATNGEKQLFYEQHLNNYFESTIEEVLAAEFQFNQRLLSDGYASLNDLFEYLGVEPIKGGDAIGWSTKAGAERYGYSCVDFEHEIVEIAEGMECCIIDLPYLPTADYLQ